jgi:ABC-type uncharacterized transport system permease subunit
MSDTFVEAKKQSPLRAAWEFLVKYQAIVVPIVALLAAFSIGAVLIALQGVNPSYAYQSLFRAAFGSSDGLLRTFQKTTPLIFAGLAVAVALKVGLFNIGAQGQLMFGALFSAWTGYQFEALPSIVLIPLCLAMGVLGGAMWASIAGLLKAYRGVHEVISTIMLNSIAYGVIEYIVANPLREPNQPLLRTSEIGPNAFLYDHGFVPTGLIIATVAAFLLALMLNRTVLGFKLNTVGKNKYAAGYAGIRIPRMVLMGMLISGGLAGLGGSVETLGVIHRYETGFNNGLGFDGITIALLARGNPLATIPAAILVGALRAGATALQFDTGIAPEIVDMILAISLLLVSIPVLANLLFGKRAQKLETLTSGWGA